MQPLRPVRPDRVLGELREAVSSLATDRFRVVPGRWGFPIASLLISVFFAALYCRSSVVWTDDALIYFRLASHVLQGLGPVFNAGDVHGGGTSLLWTYLLAASKVLLPSLDFPQLSLVLATALTFGSCWLLTLTLRGLVGDLSLLAPFSLVSIDLFRLLPGLEIPLAIFGVCLVLWSYCSLRSPALAAALLGVAFFCRGDAILLAVPMGLHMFLSGRSRSEDALRRLVAPALVGAAVVLVGLLIQHATTGTFLPPTLRAKSIQGAVGPWALYASGAPRYVHQAIGSRWVLLGPAALGLWALGKPAGLLVVAAILHWFGYLVLTVADYAWYSWLIQLSLRLAVVVGMAVAVCVPLAVLAKRPRMAVAGVLLGGIFLGGARLPSLQALPRFEHDAALGGSGWFKTYHAVAGIVCDNRTGGAKARLLAQEVGALGYYCPQSEIRDVNGLASPGLTKQNLNDWDYWVRRYEPDYLIMLGDAGPERRFSSELGPALRYERILLRHELDHVPVGVYRQTEVGRE